MQYSNVTSFINNIINRAEIKLKRTCLVSRPLEIILEPTLKCNSNCIMCNRNFNRSGTKSADGFLSWDTFNKVEPFFKYAERVLFGGFGESLLHPEYPAMLREIKKARPFVYFFTNGILMKENIGRELVDEKMDMICVSIGGATRETYRKVRGVNELDRVVENIRLLNEYKKKVGKKKPVVTFHVVAMKSTLPELEMLVKLAHEIGVEHIDFAHLVVQGESLNQESLWHDVEVAKEAFNSAALTAHKLGVSFQIPNFNICVKDCTAIFKTMVVNWDGIVMSCALERFNIGDLNVSTINDIWNGKGIRKLREDYFTYGIMHVCPNCLRWDNRPETFLKPSVNSRDVAKRI